MIGSLAAWERVSDIRFFEASLPDEADIRFGWREIDGPGGVLGQTTIPVSGPLHSVVIALDVEDRLVFVRRCCGRQY